MTTIHWRSPISGLFNSPQNWNPSQVPTANDDVFIDAVGAYTVTSSSSHAIKTLSTISTAALAVTGGSFTITGGTGAGANAGTISVGNAAALAIGSTFKNTGKNTGKITLNSEGHKTDLAIIGNTTLSGTGTVTLGADGHSAIISNGATARLVNESNTISGGGLIGDAHLTLVNQAHGVIDGNSMTAPLSLNTGTSTLLKGAHAIGNAGLIEGTTAEGLVIVSDVSNEGRLEALGTNARLQIDGTVTNVIPPLSVGGIVTASGRGAHVDLSGAKITGGRLQVGSGSTVETLAGSGVSVILGIAVSNLGTLEANSNSELRVQGSNIGATGTLVSNGNGALLDINGNVGAVSARIGGGEIEFKGGSAAKVAFDAGTTGTLKLDVSTAFTGTISGFAGPGQNVFTQFIGFGDSSIDSGSLRYLPTGEPNQDARIQNAVTNGGTGSPVGVGLMNSQLLAGDFGLTANSAYGPEGGTNYAIAGAVNAAVPENGNIGNINDRSSPNPDSALISTVDQISSYLSSTQDANGIAHADPNALYLISSGANDVSFAADSIGDSTLENAYLNEQAANLTAAIQRLVAAGAQHIIVNTVQNPDMLAEGYSSQLFSDLNTAGVTNVQSDVRDMVQTVKANLSAFGFTEIGPALIGPTTGGTFKGWGLWGADTTTPESSSVPQNRQYAYLSSSDAEQTSLFSDDQHLSAAGQLIEANYIYSLLVSNEVISQDALDLADINYAFGTTNATFSGDANGGTLTVTDGVNTANIALLGNYLASTFITASDGGAGTLVVDQSGVAQQPAMARPSRRAVV